MAAIEMGSQPRPLNREINMIPFIDLLMVTIAFLLITAVWVTFSRISADAQLPASEGVPTNEEKILHLYAEDTQYRLVWKLGATTLSESSLPRDEGSSETAIQEKLAVRIAAEWKQHGQHSDPQDRQPDRCVLHADNRAPFSEMVAAIDAVYDAHRTVITPQGVQLSVPVFDVGLSSR